MVPRRYAIADDVEVQVDTPLLAGEFWATQLGQVRRQKIDRPHL